MAMGTTLALFSKATFFITVPAVGQDPQVPLV